MRYFLVERSSRGLEKVTVYYDDAVALDAYLNLERHCPPFTAADRECLLLGADSLATCLATHGSWFDVGDKSALAELVDRLAATPGTSTFEIEGA